MKRCFLGAMVVFVTLLFCANVSCKSLEKQGNNVDQIVGVWQYVTESMSGNVKMKKIITKNHFLVVWTVDNEIVNSVGGTYSFDGKTYTENVEFGTPNVRNRLGSKTIVDVRFEGNRKHISGVLFGTTPFNEVWERIE